MAMLLHWLKILRFRVANNRGELRLEIRPLDLLSRVLSLYHMISRINERILVLFTFINLTKVDLALCKNK